MRFPRHAGEVNKEAPFVRIPCSLRARGRGELSFSEWSQQQPERQRGRAGDRPRRRSLLSLAGDAEAAPEDLVVQFLASQATIIASPAETVVD